MVKIISDSTSDLTKELIDKLDISVIPLHILLGNDEYRDGIDITPDKIYEWADENKKTTKTSGVSIDDTIEMFKCVLEEDRDIVAFAYQRICQLQLMCSDLRQESLRQRTGFM